MKRLLLVPALLCLPSTALAQQPPAQPAPPAAATMPVPDTETFHAEAASTDALEILSSQLAVERSTTPAIVEFANKLIADHTATSTALNGGNPPPPPETVLNEKHRGLLDQLRGAAAADFDATYKQMQVDGHREAIALFTAYAQGGTDAAHKEFATSTLPHLEEHLRVAESL